jgi:CRISPR-associated protein Cmr5
MGKKNIEQMVPVALEILERPNDVVVDKAIANKYRGYVASLGASIMQCGLIPTIAFNEANEDRRKINGLLKQLLLQFRALIPCDGNLLHMVITQASTGNDQRQQLRRLTILFLDASVALKLAMRTYRKAG